MAIDPQRILAAARKRLAAFSSFCAAGASRPGRSSLPSLGSERLVATPIEVKGSRRWQLAGQISAGYLVSHVVKEASGQARELSSELSYTTMRVGGAGPGFAL